MTKFIIKLALERSFKASDSGVHARCARRLTADQLDRVKRRAAAAAMDAVASCFTEFKCEGSVSVRFD